MITFKINDIALDLSQDFSISFEKTSPLFAENAGERAYSYPIKLPLTPTNRQALAFIDLADSAALFETSYPCLISDSGNDLVVGLFYISSIDATINGYILEESFEPEVLDTRLKDIEMGGDVTYVDGITYDYMYEVANAAASGNCDTWDFCFPPTKNSRFYEGAVSPNSPDMVTIDPTNFDTLPYHYGGFVNLWMADIQSYFLISELPLIFHNYNVDTDVIDIAAQSTFVPYPYLITILRKISDHLGYELQGSWVNDEAIKKLCIYNTYALDFWEWVSAHEVYNTYNVPINLINHIPDITISEMFDALKNLFNLSISIDSLKKEIRIDAKKTILAETNEEFTAPHTLTVIQPPKTTEGFSLSMTIDEDDNRQILYKDLIATDIILDDGDTFAASDPTGALKWDPDQYRTYINGNLYRGNKVPSAPKYLQGTAKTEVVAEVGTLDTLKNYPIDYAWDISGGLPAPVQTMFSGIIPVAEQIGNSNEYLVDGNYWDGKTALPNPYIFRILFYAGMHTDPNGYGDYPFATENVYDDQMNQVLPYSLKWKGGAHSLYEAWWKDWKQALEGKQMTFFLYLSMAEFLAFDLSKKYRIQNRLYVIKKIAYSISRNGISYIKAECVQL
jgi:hypothetical protein